MSHVYEDLQRRYTDLAPVGTHDQDAVSKIKADAQIGRRSTDDVLAKRFKKSDAAAEVTQKETHFDPNDLIISRTDMRGSITYCNEIFAKMSGWTQEELMGSNHNIIRHPDMPKVAFNLSWNLIKQKKEFYGYVKNLRKDGGFYWVFAYITADLDEKGEIVGYTSYRRFAPKLAVKTMEPIYKLLLEAEKEGGVEASSALLNRYLEQSGFLSYDQFIVDLQIKANASLN